MIRIEPILLNSDRHGTVWDVFLVNEHNTQLHAYYGVSGHLLYRVVDTVGHCNKLKDRKLREALLRKELPKHP